MSEACHALHQSLSRLPRLRAGYAENRLPANGVYVVFEQGEQAHGVERIVRIGTHTGQGNLASRLREHLYTPNKDRSIFRKHVGRCLLNQRGDPLLSQWNISLTARKARELHSHRIDHRRLAKIEEEVSEWITGRFSFAILPLESKQQRLALEEALLSTLAACPLCQPSPEWLGRHHPSSDAIRQSGLWNIQRLKGVPLTRAEAEALTVACAIHPHSTAATI